MKHKLSLLFFLFLFYPGIQAQIRIACVGNSITFGAGIANREKNSYPAQLQSMLGDGYNVMNYGVSGRTLLKKGNLPYWNTKEYQAALASSPDIVFIKLGTNDSKAVNRPFYNEFESNYKELIQSFRSLATHPRVVLLLPVPSFMTDSNQIFDPVIRSQIIPRIQQVAYETGCEVVNLYPLFVDRSDLFPDNIHPSSLGATLIAKRLYEVVKLSEQPKSDIISKLKEKTTVSSFYGFKCVRFTFEGRSCQIVQPKKAVKGLPWIWRTRFWGHEPQTDIALLERGFHVVECDVAELFGNDEAIRIWNKFYSYLHGLGLNKKVVLEGFSRGGVYAYNWAYANSDKVACVYADAPVLDLRSWPGGKGKSSGSPEDWEIFKKDFKLTENEAMAYDKMPLNRAAEIAKMGFPMLHVVGDADDVVPVAENTALFEQAVKNAGGDITVIHKAGVNHHPHSLPNPTPIVNFILTACKLKINFAALPVPGSEYRSGAGWKNNKGWWGQRDDIDSLLAAEKNLDILFVGNSITQGLGGHRPNVTGKPGLAAFESAFAGYKWETAGISGDKTQHVLWRLQHGNYKLSNPKVLVVTIGVNNFADDSAEEITAGIGSIVKWLKSNMPSTKVILVGPLPAGLNNEAMMRKKYKAVNQIISRYQGGNVYYRPMCKSLILSNGDLDLNCYSGDGIHLTPNGYKVWAAEMKAKVKEILK